jgi:hypothetical protein
MFQYLILEIFIVADGNGAGWKLCREKNVTALNGDRHYEKRLAE